MRIPSASIPRDRVFVTWIVPMSLEGRTCAVCVRAPRLSRAPAHDMTRRRMCRSCPGTRRVCGASSCACKRRDAMRWFIMCSRLIDVFGLFISVLERARHKPDARPVLGGARVAAGRGAQAHQLGPARSMAWPPGAHSDGHPRVQPRPAVQYESRSPRDRGRCRRTPTPGRDHLHRTVPLAHARRPWPSSSSSSAASAASRAPEAAAASARAACGQPHRPRPRRRRPP